MRIDPTRDGARVATASEGRLVLQRDGRRLAEALGVGVHVWRIELDAPVPESELEALSPAELTKSRRFVFERDRRRYLAAHIGLRRVLSACTGHAPDELDIRETAEGKPHLADARLAFSLSHSHDLGLVAVAAAGHVGVDVELVGSRPDEMAIACDLFAAAEIRQLETLDGDARNLMFHRLWTCREAVLKAVGIGLAGEGLALGVDARGTIRIESPPAGWREPFELSEFRIGTDYTAAVAWTARDPKAQVVHHV